MGPHKNEHSHRKRRAQRVAMGGTPGEAFKVTMTSSRETIRRDGLKGPQSGRDRRELNKTH